MNRISYVQLPNGETKTFFGMIGANHGPDEKWVWWKWCLSLDVLPKEEEKSTIIYSHHMGEHYKRRLPANWRVA